ncbi:hypothetical protein ACIQMV_33855 [Streptomyces sp. NPDC091412]|uniref:hypothetical protein n=1 Tax=Streptomyces sp. NPDC091412 TaxID=3366002 RepID=UPI00381C37B7
MIRSLIERRRARRAAATAAQLSAHFDAQMQAAADSAITAARRELSRRMPTLPLQHMDRERVDVRNVLDVAHEHFGLVAVPPERVAAILRARYALQAGAIVRHKCDAARSWTSRPAAG